MTKKQNRYSLTKILTLDQLNKTQTKNNNVVRRIKKKETPSIPKEIVKFELVNQKKSKLY
jgi:hypothetical protein